MDKLLYQMLLEERAYLEKEMKKLRKALEHKAEGKLRGLMSKGKYPQYYLMVKDETGEERLTYLPKDQRGIAEKIAQSQYDEEMLGILERRWEWIQPLLACYEVSLEEEFERLPRARQLLVKPLIERREELIKTWESSMETGRNSYEISGNIFTERGEHVRSKTEKIIADILWRKGIPYVYEPMLRLDNQTLVYPDFAILNLRTRQTMYYEHFGMMDDAEYSEKAVAKIRLYEKHGYWFGEKLLYSMETRSEPADMRAIEAMIQKYCE